jgi:hypothetical protein
MYEYSCGRQKIFHCWIVATFNHQQHRSAFFTRAGFFPGKFQTFLSEVVGIAFWDKQDMYPGNNVTKDEPISYYI